VFSPGASIELLVKSEIVNTGAGDREEREEGLVKEKVDGRQGLEGR
jgi:hypothetical protein